MSSEARRTVPGWTTPATAAVHTVPAAPQPAFAPPGVGPTPESVRFDPSLHLQLEPGCAVLRSEGEPFL